MHKLCLSSILSSISSSFLCFFHLQFSFVSSPLFVTLMHPYFLLVLISLSSTHTHRHMFLFILISLSSTHTQTHVSGAADLLTKNGESIHFSQLLPHDAGGNMKTVKHPKTTTVNVGDGPPRVVPLDKEDEYAMGMHSPLLFYHLLGSLLHFSPLLFCHVLSSSLLSFSLLSSSLLSFSLLSSSLLHNNYMLVTLQFATH